MYEELLNYLDALAQELDESDMQNAESRLIKDEFKNAMAFIRLGAALKNYIEKEMGMSRDQKIEYLEKMKAEYATFLVEHRRVWMSRNKSGGIERSMKALLKLESEINDRLRILNSGIITRSWNRLKVRTISAAVAVIL